MNNFIAIGDSHVDMYAPFCRALCKVPGATAYGLGNDSSSTRARRAFLGFLSNLKEFIPIVCLGEVDCNSLFWHKEISDNRFLNKSVRSLMRFLSETSMKFIISSVIPPAVDNYQVTRVRSHVTSSKAERTQIVQKFNNLLKIRSAIYGHTYMDITSSLLSSNGLLNMSYAKSHTKTHLDVRKVKPIIEEKLLEAESLYNNL